MFDVAATESRSRPPIHRLPKNCLESSESCISRLFRELLAWLLRITDVPSCVAIWSDVIAIRLSPDPFPERSLPLNPSAASVSTSLWIDSIMREGNPDFRIVCDYYLRLRRLCKLNISRTKIWGLGFGVWGLGFGVWGLGFGVW